MKSYLLLAPLLFHCLLTQSQNCSDMNIQLASEIASTCNSLTMTMLHDQLDRPYLYVANKSTGLTVYDISNVAMPLAVDTVPASLLGNLDVMNLTQDGNYLYLAIGNHFTNPQQGGMAIIDVTDPTAALATDFFIVPNSESGAGIVKVEGDFAYLGAMNSGLVILDIADKNNITFISEFVPDINYPVPNPNPNLYNARGMEVKNSIVYLVYDAGGFRIINCSEKSNPVETGRYANPATFVPFNLPRAYNNIVLDDSLAYISVDYCGLEVLNISDTSNILLAGWWNPYNCPENNWFTSPSHANELFLNKDCQQLFVSTGRSDMIVLDISNPFEPDSCNYYGGVSNNIGTWGVSSYQNQIYLSYICAIIPFPSNWTGIKLLTYTPCSETRTKENVKQEFNAYPNPSTGSIRFDFAGNEAYDLTFFESNGTLIKTIDRYASGTTIIFDKNRKGLIFYLIRNPSDGSLVGQGKFVMAQ